MKDRAVCERQDGGRESSLKRRKHWVLRMDAGTPRTRLKSRLSMLLLSGEWLDALGVRGVCGKAPDYKRRALPLRDARGVQRHGSPGCRLLPERARTLGLLVPVSARDGAPAPRRSPYTRSFRWVGFPGASSRWTLVLPVCLSTPTRRRHASAPVTPGATPTRRFPAHAFRGNPAGVGRVRRHGEPRRQGAGRGRLAGPCRRDPEDHRPRPGAAAVRARAGRKRQGPRPAAAAAPRRRRPTRTSAWSRASRSTQ